MDVFVGDAFNIAYDLKILDEVQIGIEMRCFDKRANLFSLVGIGSYPKPAKTALVLMDDPGYN